MIAGCDIGGAHLKCAALDAAGRLTGVWEIPCRLCEGLHRLDEALATLPTRLGKDTHRHALTMTLADWFRDSERGAEAFVSYMVQRLGSHRVGVSAGRWGLYGRGTARGPRP